MPTISPAPIVNDAGRAGPPWIAKVANLQASASAKPARMATGIELLQIPADHELDEIVVIDRRIVEFAGVAAVAQHGYAVGDAFHFRQPMRNVDDAHARALQSRRSLRRADRFLPASSWRSARP